MVKEINIAEILKDKPKGTKLYSPIFGEVTLYEIYKELDTNFLFVKDKDGDMVFFEHDGKYNVNGECVLFPSKENRYWSKFAWKKGDVLVSNDSDSHIVFNGFSKDDYTIFEGKHWISVSKKRHISCLNMQNTQNYHIEDNKEVAQTYIKTIEERLGGKLNRETLEIEKQPEFKDGDILYITDRIVFCYFIMIYKNQEGDRIYHYATLPEDNLVIMTKRGFLSDNGGLSKRYATEEEKQQLFEALAKKGKAWDAEKKAIVDLKPKCEFKPFDRCIWKIRNCEGSIWQASFVSYVDEYGATPMGMSIDEDLVNLIILPYNDQTKLLVGTTDEWEGGEQ